MNFLTQLFSSTGLKEKILKQFIETAKKEGIRKMLLELDKDDQLKTTVLDPNYWVLIDKPTHDFLIKFYNENKPF